MERVTEQVTYSIGPGRWYHLPDTDVEIYVHSGAMINMTVRKRELITSMPEPTLPDAGISEKVTRNAKA